MKKSKKILSILLATMLTISCLAGCGGSSNSDGKVTITVPDLVLNPIGEDKFKQEKQDAFDELYGDKIEVKHILPSSSSDVNDVQNLSALLLGNDAPAYVNVSSTIYMKDLYNMGLIRDISDLVKDNEVFNANMQRAIDACKYSDGSIIGYPTGVEVPMLGFYNEALTKAGYDPTTFTCETWDDYYEVIKKLTAGSRKGGSLCASEFFLWPNNWLLSNGAQVAIQNEDGTISLNYTDDKVVETINFLKKIYGEGLTNENINYTDIDQIFSLMYNRSVASFTMYPTWIQRFTSAGISPAEITLCQYPKGPSGEYTNVMYVAATVFNASLTDEELEAAIQYVAFMNSEEYYSDYFKFCQENSISMLKIPCVENVDWWSHLTDFPNNWIESTKKALETAEDTSLDSTGFSTYITAALPDIITLQNNDVKASLQSAEKTTKTEWLENYNANK